MANLSASFPDEVYFSTVDGLMIGDNDDEEEEEKAASNRENVLNLNQFEELKGVLSHRVKLKMKLNLMRKVMSLPSSHAKFRNLNVPLPGIFHARLPPRPPPPPPAPGCQEHASIETAQQ